MAVYQNLTLTQLSQSQEENTSQVRILWQSTQTGGSYNMTQRTASYRVYVNGEAMPSVEIGYVLPMQSTVVLADVTVTVPHNHKGEAVVTVSTFMDTRISAGVVELTKTLTLDAIGRASVLRAADCYVGGLSKLSVVKKNSAFSHSIAYRFGNCQGYVDGEGKLQNGEVIFSGEQVDFQIPLSFYGEIPCAKSGQCVLTLQTYDGERAVGESQEAVFTVTAEEAACHPEVWGTVADGNPDTLAVTGDANKLVRYMSEAICTISGEAKHGAQITKKVIAGREPEENQVVISEFSQESVLFSLWDSRGFQGEFSHSCDLIPYIKLSAEATAQRENAGSQAMVYVSGDCFGGSFGEQENALTVEITVDGREPLLAEATVSENRYYAFAELEDMDYTRIYGITVRVCDRLMQIEKRVTLKKAVPVFDWGEEDFAFHVPVQMDSPLPLNSGGTGTATWTQSGVVVKEKNHAGLTAVAMEKGAFYVDGDGKPMFSSLPLEMGGTGADNAVQAGENLGFIFPLEPGKEYQTLQRWNGQIVYTKLVEFGALPDNSSKGVVHDAAATRILQCWGSTSEGKTLPYGGKHVYRIDLFCDREKIYIDTEMDCSAHTATVQIWYIK